MIVSYRTSWMMQEDNDLKQAEFALSGNYKIILIKCKS